VSTYVQFYADIESNSANTRWTDKRLDQDTEVIKNTFSPKSRSLG
jgi:hypothetical protein